MDVRQIELLRDELDAYLAAFADCFCRCDTRRHLSTYVRGQLSPLQAKSVEPIALHAGTPVRTLQEFLAQHRWDEEAVLRRLAEMVARDQGGPRSIGIIDETSDVKKGDKTPGVQRQWCGSVGKVENSIVTVHLAFARDDFHCLLDGELYLPEAWAEDRDRCREAGIPDEMQYRAKWRIALELYDRAVENGVTFEWITADEGYGGKPGFLETLDEREQRFVVEVPRNFAIWPQRPKTTKRPFRKGGHSRPRKTPRVQAGELPTRSVEEFFWFDASMKTARWRQYYIKDTQKGPVTWEAKRARVVIKRDDGLPGIEVWLIVARNLQDPSEMKFFVSNASCHERTTTILLAAFSRWRVERSFEDQKQEIGLDCYEGRRYLGLKRHLVLSCVSYLFLSMARQRLREKKSGRDSSATAVRDQHRRSVLVGT